MRKSIGIFVYSFQNKDLIDNLTDIVNKSSGLHDLSFYVIDQNNVERSRLFNITASHVKIIYKHTKWDSIKSPVAHKFDGSRIEAVTILDVALDLRAYNKKARDFHLP